MAAVPRDVATIAGSPATSNGRRRLPARDITDRPAQVSERAIGAGGRCRAGLRCYESNYGHSAESSADGKLAFIADWDSGYVALDLTNPAKPVYNGCTRSTAPTRTSTCHSDAVRRGRKLLDIWLHEDFADAGPSGSGASPRATCGCRSTSTSSTTHRRRHRRYWTPNTIGGNDQGAGDYTIHEQLPRRDDALHARVYTDRDSRHRRRQPAGAERRVAYFVPPATTNPVKPSQRGVLTNTTQVWGSVVDEATGLVYAAT